MNQHPTRTLLLLTTWIVAVLIIAGTEYLRYH